MKKEALIFNIGVGHRKSNVEGTMLDRKALEKIKETANIVTE